MFVWNTASVHVASLEPTIGLTAFATVFLAELPDKTMLATIVLSARFRRPFSVWVGAAAALTVQMVIATTAGRLLSVLPAGPVRFAVAALFALGAFVLWRSRDHDPGETASLEVDVAPRDTGSSKRVETMPARRIVATVFGIVFIAEWGDLTQIATASLAASGDAGSVFVGAALAMVSVAAIGVVAGGALLRVVPARVLHRVAAAVFAVLALVFLVDAIRTVDIDTSMSISAADPGARGDGDRAGAAA